MNDSETIETKATELSGDVSKFQTVISAIGTIVLGVVGVSISHQGNELNRQANRIAAEQTKLTKQFSETTQQLAKLAIPPVLTSIWRDKSGETMQTAYFINQGGPCFATRAEVIDVVQIGLTPKSGKKVSLAIPVTPEYESSPLPSLGSESTIFEVLGTFEGDAPYSIPRDAIHGIRFEHTSPDALFTTPGLFREQLRKLLLQYDILVLVESNRFVRLSYTDVQGKLNHRLFELYFGTDPIQVEYEETHEALFATIDESRGGRRLLARGRDTTTWKNLADRVMSHPDVVALIRPE